MRDQIEKPTGILHEYKLEFDKLTKEEKERVLSKLHSDYERGYIK